MPRSLCPIELIQELPADLKTIIYSAILLLTVTVSPAFGKNLGTVGRVYTVVEPDALEEIQTAAARVDWDKAVDRQKMLSMIRDFRPADLHPLPAARADRTFLQDMTYTLDIDIPDGKGGILYPKGFSFNPLDYVNLTSVLVVIDGGDRRQVDWFKTSPYADDYRTRLLLASGDYYDLNEELERPVFYLMDTVARRLGLAAVPSVIRQQGTMLEVHEIMVPYE